MKSYTLKVQVKNTKPPIWYRVNVPHGITFSSLALLLNRLLGLPGCAEFRFECMEEGLILRETVSSQQSWQTFDQQDASSTYIDDYLDQKRRFSYFCGEQTSFRLDVEQIDARYPFAFPLILKISKAAASNDEEAARLSAVSEEYAKACTVECRLEPAYLTLKELQESLAKGLPIPGMEKPVTMGDNRQAGTCSVVRQLSAKYADLAMKQLKLDELKARIDNAGEEERKLLLAEAGGEIDSIASQLKELKRQMQEELHSNLRQRQGYGVPVETKLSKVLQSAYGKTDLLVIAGDIHLQRYRSLGKPDLAEKIANELLTSSTMKRRLLYVRDDVIEVFEKIMAQEWSYIPEDREEAAVERLYDLRYVFWLADETVIVPSDVKKVYQRINTPEFRTMRRESVWLLDCLNMVPLYYVTIPLDRFYRLFRKGSSLSLKELPARIREMDPDLSPCVLQGNKLITRSTLKNDLYLELEKSQRDMDYYIPSRREVEEIMTYGYPAGESYCRNMRSFVMNEFELDPEEADDLTAEMWSDLNMGHDVHDILSRLSEDEYVFSSEEGMGQFMELFMKLNAETRMWIHKGHNPKEVSRTHPPFANGRMPTIVPGSSHAAAMLQEIMPEIEKRGFTVDLDSNAVEVTQTEVSGDQKIISMNRKKVYPNDPCPCGSGKKFKYCCGRK